MRGGIRIVGELSTAAVRVPHGFVLKPGGKRY